MHDGATVGAKSHVAVTVSPQKRLWQLYVDTTYCHHC